ncbi:MAG: transposase, partial [Lachnospiraceae bacterium]|nr:transposase [Lachnospiraceae bacterium]
MAKFTTETYILKRDILTFVRKITHTLRLPERKFITDMIYGLLAAESCKLSDISDALHEKIKKKNTIERLSKNLAKGVPMEAWKFYLHMIKKWEDNPVIHIDDTDVSKEYGKKFEAIGRVRDGSASGNKNIYKNGYYITEGTVLTKSFHPISFFSKVHSSHEKDYISANAITFAAIERGAKLFKKAMFVMDRGYDDNKMFLMLDKLGQHYIIRLTRNRKLLLGNGKWAKASEMCARRKG